MSNWFVDNYTFIIIALGAMALGLVNGVLGTFITLKKQALVGDALSHAALPGIVLAFMFTQSRSMPILLIGAMASAGFAILVIELIKRFSNIKYDAGLALILSSFFGFGQVLLLVVQTTGDGSSAGLHNFIFGQAATMLRSDVIFIISATIVVLIIIMLLWKEFKLHIFDNEFYQSMGFSNKLTTIILNILVVVVVTISIRTVGVILMSALLIAPVVAARQFSNKLHINVILSGLIGLVSAFIGVRISANVTNLPTGPVIVVVLCSLVVVALFFSPKRGIIYKIFTDSIHKKEIKKYRVLIHAYHHNGLVTEMIDINKLEQLGFINYDNENYYLTKKGSKKVEAIIGEQNAS